MFTPVQDAASCQGKADSRAHQSAEDASRGEAEHSSRRVRPRQLVEIRATKSQVMLHSTAPDTDGETLLAMHPRAVGRGVRVVEETHWDGLPTGQGRRTTTGDASPRPRPQPRGEEVGPLQALLNRAAATRVEVGRRPLSVYDELTGTRPFTTNRATKESS
jgi:hypothetical protein